MVLDGTTTDNLMISRFLKLRLRWVLLSGCLLLLLLVQYDVQNRYFPIWDLRPNITDWTRRLLDYDDKNDSIDHGKEMLNLSAVDLEFLMQNGHSHHRIVINNTVKEQASAKAASMSSPLSSRQSGSMINVLFCLHGANPFFIDEWEVAFKSVLINSPLDNPLHIHIIANGPAHDAVRQRIRHTIGLVDSLWRNPITITSYNVEHRQEEFQQVLLHGLRGKSMDQRVSLGGYYRLLSPKVLPPGTGPVLYMDVDAVIMANLGDLWKHVNASYAFQASATWLCSAFIIVNVDRAVNFWELLDKLPEIESGGDQVLLREVSKANPGIMGPLPPEWDTHMGHGHRGEPHKVLDKRPNGVGMLHFNGNRPNYFHGAGLMQYCHRAKSCNQNEDAQKLYEQTWMMADYYVKMPWQWAKYLGGVSKIPLGQEGHALKYEEVISNSTDTTSMQDQ